MELLDFNKIDIIQHKNPRIVKVAIDIPLSALGWEHYTSLIADTAADLLAKTKRNSPTCYEIDFRFEVEEEDFIHFANLFADAIVEGLIEDRDRDREKRLGVPNLGGVSNIVLKKAVNKRTMIDAVNVVCKSEIGTWRMV